MKFTKNDTENVEEDSGNIFSINDLEPINDEKRSPQEENNVEEDFYINLAENYPDEGLNKLSSFLLDAIDEDIAARKPSRDAIEKGYKYLGLSVDDIDKAPFPFATRTFDGTMRTALYRNFTTIIAELLKTDGYTDYKLKGLDNPELDIKAEKIKAWFNYYLTHKDPVFRTDFEKCILYNIFEGSSYKKIYYDGATGQQKSRFVSPENFVIDSDCTSILESSRLTHILHLSKRDILLKIQNGIYRDVELPYLKFGDNNNDDDDLNTLSKKDGVDLTAYSRRSLFPHYEVHTYLNLEEFIDNTTDLERTIPLPYIITIDKITKKILSIYRNWKQDSSPDQIKRREYFVQYNYLSGFGIDGVGLVQLMGSDAKTITTQLRMLTDAGAFSNLPGGVRVKGFKEQQTDLIIGPGQWPEIDTGGTPLKDSFMNLPYPGPNNTLRELMMGKIEQAREAGSISEMGMLQSKEDIPTNTVLAALEVHNRIQSAVFRSIHSSFSHELQLLYDLFKNTLEPQRFYTDEGETEITREDFLAEIEIVPAADPAVNSTVLKLIRAEIALQTASTDPSLHNMPQVYRMNYKAQGLSEEEIDKILKPEQEPQEIVPLDPITENQNFLLGKAVKAAEWQFHPGHILTHGIFAEEYPDLKPLIMDHIREHQAFEYLIKSQQLLGVQLPPLEEIQDPQVQNSIAMGIATALEENGISSNQQNAPVDPNALLMADIEQKAAETAAKERIAKLKAETDVFKAQLDFEKEKAKIESEEDIAQLKSETELIKQGVSNG